MVIRDSGYWEQRDINYNYGALAYAVYVDKTVTTEAALFSMGVLEKRLPSIEELKNLHYNHNLSYQAIADMFGMVRKTVWYRINRAKSEKPGPRPGGG